MDESISNEIIEQLKKNISTTDNDEIDFSFNNLDSIPFSKDYFYPINSNKESSNSKIVFIDGGLANLFSSPSFSVDFIRVHSIIYSNNKRVDNTTDEFYVITNTVCENNKIFYSTKLLKNKKGILINSFYESSFTFNSYDAELRTGKSRVNINVIPNVIRRLSELSVALLTVGSINSEDSIILDGDLDFKTDDEEKLISALKTESISKKINICGLSKTSGLLTKQGKSISFSLNNLSDLDCWMYYPLVLEKNISFIKLNGSSEYVFRFDSFRNPRKMGELFISLKRNSNDAVFLGYPYGLIEADKFARISNEEAEYHKVLLFSKSGNASKLFRKLDTSTNAHSILDNIL